MSKTVSEMVIKSSPAKVVIADSTIKLKIEDFDEASKSGTILSTKNQFVSAFWHFLVINVNNQQIYLFTQPF